MLRPKLNSFFSLQLRLFDKIILNNLYQLTFIIIFIFSFIFPIYASSYNEETLIQATNTSEYSNNLKIANKINISYEKTINYSPKRSFINKNILIVDTFLPNHESLTYSWYTLINTRANKNELKHFSFNKNLKNIFYEWNCTWYVAEHKNVDWSWDAKDWINNASLKWHKISKEPVIGSIIVFDGGWYKLWHVWIVEYINWDTITISEMNYKAFWKINLRKISKTHKTIKWYIITD